MTKILQKVAVARLCMALFFLGASVYLCFLAFAIGNGENRGTTQPILEIDAPAIDFGDVKQHQTLTKRCKLTNRSTSILVIRDLVKSCGCTTAEVTSTEIEPGASVFLDIEWNTRSLRGRNTEVVGINFTKKTDEETMTVTLSLIANVQPSVKSSVDHLEFSIAEPASKSVTFQRVDTKPLAITSCKTSQEAFRVTHEGAEVRVIFEPKNYRPESGAMAVLIRTDCPEEPVIQLPIKILK